MVLVTIATNLIAKKRALFAMKKEYLEHHSVILKQFQNDMAF
jgi:hypothetical protein